MDPLGSQDVLIFIVVPLMVITISEVRKNWKSIWDAELTTKDRDMLMRIAMFVLLPIVVLLHEIGHSVAILAFGGQIAEFHYGLLWGYVRPMENIPLGGFSHLQWLIIFLAGNVVQIIAGFISLFVAIFAKSPPVVALATYLSLWSIGGTTVIYTIMSFGGMYGDWRYIYESPERQVVSVVALCHAVIVALILWAVYGQLPKYWFAKKTRPKWAWDHTAIETRANSRPTAHNLLALAWSYYAGNLDGFARYYLKKSQEVDKDSPDALLLEGWLTHAKGKLDKAIAIFRDLAHNPSADNLLKAKASMAIGQCVVDKLNRSQRGRQQTTEIWAEAVKAYTDAITAYPNLADPKFYRAVLLNKAGMHDRAEVDLLSLNEMHWLDPSLQSLVEKELEVTRQSINDQLATLKSQKPQESTGTAAEKTRPGVMRESPGSFGQSPASIGQDGAAMHQVRTQTPATDAPDKKSTLTTKNEEGPQEPSETPPAPPHEEADPPDNQAQPHQ